MRYAVILAAAIGFSTPALAAQDAVWPDLSENLYGDRTLLNGDRHISIDAPYRTKDDARTQIAAEIAAPEGTELASVTLILDDNPMPVSAVFEFDRPLPRFFFDVTMRVNGPTPLHVVAEMTDGRLFVSETFVKTSGLGACSAPPGTDPDLALANLGKMTIEVDSLSRSGNGAAGDLLASLTAREMQLDVDISHPSHSGMQMDQISLLYIPLRYVESVEIDLDGGGYVDLTGSISLSENPTVSLSVPSTTQSVDITMTDTDGTVTQAHKDLPGF